MSKPLQKQRENRSAEQRDESFHPYPLTPQSARTAVLLLRSPEQDVLCQTLRALTKFCQQDIANRTYLFDLNTIESVLPHIEHAEINIRRFAFKTLAQLCQLDRGPEQVLEDPECVAKIVRAMVKTEDIYVLEFASLVLAELTREPAGCEAIAVSAAGVLFQRMKTSPDPDVQNNCLQILNNLLQDPIAARIVTAQITWAPILDLLRSKFPSIQIAALRALDLILSRSKDDIVRSFRASTGLMDLFDILKCYEYRDIHKIVLHLLRDYMSTEENATHVHMSGGVLKLLAYLESSPPATKPACLSALTRLTCTVAGRQALFEYEADLELVRQLAAATGEMAADSACGITNMTRIMTSAVRMCDAKVVDTLCALLCDESAPWFHVRLNCLRALTELCRIVPEAAYAVVEPKTFNVIRNVNRKPKDSPIEAQRMAVQCYINLQIYTHSKNAMINLEFIRELLNILKRPDIQLKIETCEALCGLMSEERCRDVWTACEGERAVYEDLDKEHVGLRTALCRLMASSITDKGANVYVELGTLQYMVKNRRAAYSCPAWEVAIESIFKHNASARLAYTGRLEINHLTKDGFYVTKRLQSCFPVLNSLLSERCSPRSPIYVANFNILDDTSLGSGSIKSRTSSCTKHKTTTSSPVENQESPIISLSSMDDIHLRNYLERLQSMLKYTLALSESRNISLAVRQQAEILGKFVGEQMCGLTQDMDCSLNSVDMHVNYLKMALESNVVPLGYVRVGGALERAVLFKVLADRVGVPCALVRASYARAWCEVAIPEEEPDQTTETTLPAFLLRANYVVDLIDRPGTLIRLGSLEAERHTGNTDGCNCAVPFSQVNVFPIP